MSSPLPPTLNQIVQRFQRRTDPKQRYQQLLWYANKLEPMPDESKTPDNQVKGCTSLVYITADLHDGKITYHGDADAQLVKGLVALLIAGLNNLTPAEILAVEPNFIELMGINASLTPSRANGFFNIFQMMKNKALAFQLATHNDA